MSGEAVEKSPIPLIEPMTPEEFKQVLRAKGWQIQELAVRWKMSRVRASQICNDAERPLYYDDAVRGLPSRIM